MNKVFDVSFMVSTVPEIIAKLPVTLGLALLSAAVGLVVAFGVALLRYFRVRVASPLSRLYISYIRGTPALVQLLLVYYGIPLFLSGVNEAFGTSLSVNALPRLLFASVAFSLNCGAYMSEILRSAILSVDAGQLEACRSVNMTTWQSLRRVILPQAFVVALPGLSNSLLSIIKETSLVFNIGMVEIMAQAKIVGSRSYRFFEVYVVVALIYWLCCVVFEQLLALLEKRVRKFERQTTR